MRSVFITVAAYLGRIASATRCAFWSREPPDIDFDPELLIEIDLSRSPQAAVAGDISWSEIQVDDCIAGPGGALLGTTLGSSWPELALVGSVGLEQRAWQALPSSVRPVCPPQGAAARDYEFMSVYGSLKPLMRSHFDRHGFNPAFEHILVAAGASSPLG